GLVRNSVPLLDGMQPLSEDEVELALNNTWRPTLSVIGADGMPAPSDAGNVLRPYTTLMLSFRLPPTADPQAAMEAVKQRLSTDVPYGAQVSFRSEEHTSELQSRENIVCRLLLEKKNDVVLQQQS